MIPEQNGLIKTHLVGACAVHEEINKIFIALKTFMSRSWSHPHRTHCHAHLMEKCALSNYVCK